MEATILAAKVEILRSLLQTHAPLAVAFSGGVDSSLLYCEARRHLGEQAVAVIGVSPSLSSRDLENARAVARHLSAPLWELATSELNVEEYRKNSGNRCYHCKSELFKRITEEPRMRGYAICDGSHVDDRPEDRPGMHAALTHGVLSPLRMAGFTKQEVRALARERGLPSWDRPAGPCLASRIATGTVVDAEKLAAVEAVEQVLERHGFGVFRARIDRQDLILELDPNQLSRLGEETWRKELLAMALPLGFRKIVADLQGYRSKEAEFPHR